MLNESKIFILISHTKLKEFLLVIDCKKDIKKDFKEKSFLLIDEIDDFLNNDKLVLNIVDNK